MLFRINPSDAVPIYRQMERQVRAAIASGRLRPGDRLPSHRQVAADLVINHLTVKRAYAILESAGLTVTDRGRGTFVASRPPSTTLRRRGREELIAALRDTAASARLLGLEREEFRELVDDAWEGTCTD